MPDTIAGQRRALWLSTIAFTACFAVWTIFAIGGGGAFQLPGTAGGGQHAD